MCFYGCHDCCFFFFFKQKTAYELRISDWSSDVCSSDLPPASSQACSSGVFSRPSSRLRCGKRPKRSITSRCATAYFMYSGSMARVSSMQRNWSARSEEHTSELQSLMRISYAVFCLKKQTTQQSSYTVFFSKTKRTLNITIIK